MTDANNQNPWIERADDPDATALAESWAALENLLARSQPPLDQQGLVAAVHARVLRRERRQRLVRLGAVGLALAATLLLAVSLVWFAPHRAEIAEAPADGGGQANGIQQGASSATDHDNRASPVDDDPYLAWDDAELSESLTTARQEAHQLEHNWRQPSDALVEFQYRLDALQSEIEDSSL